MLDNAVYSASAVEVAVERCRWLDQWMGERPSFIRQADVDLESEPEAKSESEKHVRLKSVEPWNFNFNDLLFER